jgi:hypothetical protein
MTQDSPKSEGSPAPTAAFFWIAVGMLVMLFLCGAFGAGLLATRAERITRDGGFAWLLFGGVFVMLANLVFSACAVCVAVSLLRREAHRTWSIALLVASCLFLWVFGSPAMRFGQSLLGQNGA